MTTESSASPSMDPYGSAKDLPSVQKMIQELRGANLLTLFIARDQRAKIREAQQDLERLTTVVDNFYKRLDSKNWVFHDLLSVSKVEALLANTSDAAGAE